jgi:hypothetical protein
MRDVCSGLTFELAQYRKGHLAQAYWGEGAWGAPAAFLPLENELHLAIAARLLDGESRPVHDLGEFTGSCERVSVPQAACNGR